MKDLLMYCCFFFLSGSVTAQAIVKPVPAVPFALPGQNGDTVALKQYKGKTVLVCLWASWCAPCRVENRKLARLYTNLKGPAFEIIHISVDTDIKKWKKAIAKDQMTWPQAIDYAAAEKSVARKWNAAVLPASYLVDPGGAVIASDAALLLIHDPEGFKTLLQQLDRQ